ncbi:MAG TPA: carboxypeptidase regulatory-like domain-containing protein, partial [Terracidiphilus sp.]|nr:carboxypeptidase regulatory-like domain-containing protein [Terracidiphilus sp.]
MRHASNSIVRTACRAVASAALLLASTLPLLSQATPPRRPYPGTAAAMGPYRIAGTVVNTSTGEPLQRATVAVLAEADSRAVESVQSDSDGRFALEHLPAGKYQLTASKRGFRTAFYNEHDEFNSAIVTGPDQDTEHLTFRLTPGAILRGVVSADGGDPVESARVMLFERPQHPQRGQHVMQLDSVNTDDTGAYEFANLAAGEYLLAVTAQPWYALHRAASGSQSGQPGDDVTALDVAYPVTYYDSTTDETSATPIVLTAGSREEADINLHAVPALRLSISAPRKPDGSIARPELRQTIFGSQITA